MQHAVTCLNQLYQTTGIYLEVRSDRALPMPGYSFLDLDLSGRLVPTVLINPRIVGDNPSVIAHVLAHEYGHHVLGHVDSASQSPRNEDEDLERENDADLFASTFVWKFGYDVPAIRRFITGLGGPRMSERVHILYSPENSL